MKFDFALVAPADALVEVDELLAEFRRNKGINALSQHVNITIGFDHAATSGVHCQQSAVWSDHFHTFWRGLDNGAKTLFTLARLCLRQFAWRDVFNHTEKELRLSKGVPEQGDGGKAQIALPFLRR